MFRFVSVLIVSLFFIGFEYFVLGVDLAGLSRAELVPTARDSWKEIKEEYLRGLAVTIRYSLVDDPRNASEARILIDEKNEYNRFSRLNYPDETIHVVNTRYSFNIRQEGDDDSWALQEMFDSPDQARTHQRMHGGVLLGTSLVFAGVMLEEAWLDDLMDSATFEILSVSPKRMENDDNEYVELTFKSDFLSDNGATKVRGGRVLLMPNLHWVVKQYEVNLESDFGENNVAHLKGTRFIDYEIIDGIPFPRRSESIYSFENDGKVFSHMKCDYVSIKRGGIPTDILYLRHYGFSEPISPSHWGSTFRIITAVLGILMILLGLYMRYLAIRRKP